MKNTLPIYIVRMHACENLCISKKNINFAPIFALFVKGLIV